MLPDQTNTPPETASPTTPSLNPTLEISNSISPAAPAIGTPKSSASKKILIIGILVLVALLVIVGALMLLVKKDESSNSNQSTTSPLTETTETSASVLESIRTGLAVLNPTAVTLSSDVAVDAYSETVADGSNVNIPSDLYNNFGNQDATLIISSIKDVLTSNGLSADMARGENHYSSNLVRCTAYASTIYGRVNCVTVDRYEAYIDKVTAVTKAVEAKFGTKMEAPFYVDFFEQSDGGKLVGVRYSAKDGGKVFIPSVYLTSSDTKTWKYIAQGKKGTQSELSPDCTLFSKDELLLFKEAGLLC